MDTTADQTLQESCMSALRHMGVEVTALVDKANRLEDENAKLRELFAAILKCSGEIDRDNGCETCPMYDSDGNVRDRTWCVWRQAARDAGFDVPIQSPVRTNEEVERLRVENAKLRELGIEVGP